MKNLVLLIMVMCLGSFVAQAETTFDVRLTEVSNDGTNYVVKIEMQMFGEDPSVFKLGSTAIQFDFPQEALSNPVLHSHVFGDSFFYLEPTVTTPKLGECSFNIELSIPNMGIEISTGDEWVELGEISFTVNDFAAYAPLNIIYNGGTTKTVVFLDDESTQIYRGAASTVNIEEADIIAQNLVAYPNPNNGQYINIEMNNIGVNQKVVIEIADALGKVVYSEVVTTNEKVLIQKVKFDQTLVDGVYSINLMIDENTITKKFVVK